MAYKNIFEEADVPKEPMTEEDFKELAGGSEAEWSSYDPSWRDRLRWFVNGPPMTIPLVGSGLPMEGVGEYGLLEMLATDLIPGRGSVWDRIKSERQLGHSGYAALEGLGGLLSIAPVVYKGGASGLASLRRSELPFVKQIRPEGNIWVQRVRDGFYVRDANQSNKIVAHVDTGGHPTSSAKGPLRSKPVTVSTPSESDDVLLELVDRGEMTLQQADDFQSMSLGSAGSKEYGSALAAGIGYGDPASRKIIKNILKQISMDPRYGKVPSFYGTRVTGAKFKNPKSREDFNSADEYKKATYGEVKLPPIREVAEKEGVPPPGRSIGSYLPERFGNLSLDDILWRLKEKVGDLGYTIKHAPSNIRRSRRHKALDKELRNINEQLDQTPQSLAIDRQIERIVAPRMERAQRQMESAIESVHKTGGIIRNPYDYEPKAI